MDRGDPCRARIRHHDAGRAEDRQAADNTEPSVEGLCCDFLAVRNGDFDIGIGAASRRGGDLGDSVADHLPWHRIDGGLARRQRQSRTRDGADARAGAKRHAGTRRADAHCGEHQRAVRHIGVVARILDDACRGGVRVAICARQRKAWPLAARQRYGDRIGKLAGHERREGRLGGGGGAGTGGPAPAQRALLLGHVCFFNPVRRAGHYASHHGGRA